MAKRKLNVGMIGYGFMGRCHSNAFRTVPNFFDVKYHPVLKAVCGRDEAKVRAFAGQWGYEDVETDWRALIKRDDIDLIDICVPNDLHKEIAIAAAKAGKIVVTEKTAVPHHRRGKGNGQGGRKRRCCELSLLQLPPRSRGHFD